MGSTLRTQDGRLIDEQGRTVILRGANLSGRHKQPPFLTEPSDAELDQLSLLGFNVIRLVLPWEAIEPARGRYDQAYLDRVVTLASRLTARGLYVIADLHQDLFARSFGGSGAPDWAIAARDVGPAPPPDRSWFIRYALDERVRRSLGRFWRNEDGIQDAFLAALGALAAKLAPVEGVIGLEPLNEPFFGDVDPERFEAEALEPFYLRAIARARAEAPEWLIFFEGLLMGSEAGTALQLRDVEGLVYFPHFYDKLAHTALAYSGVRREMERAFAAFARDAARLGVPWMLGEYGVPVGCQGADRYLEDHEEALGEAGVGGTVWQLNPSSQDWNDEEMSLCGPGFVAGPLLRIVARPFARAIAGRPLASRWSSEQGVFQLEIASGPAPEAPTEIVLPAHHFPNGAVLEVSAGQAHWENGLARWSGVPPGARATFLARRAERT